MLLLGAVNSATKTSLVFGRYLTGQLPRNQPLFCPPLQGIDACIKCLKIWFELLLALLKAMMTLRCTTAELAVDPLGPSAGEMSEVFKGSRCCAVQYGVLFLLLLHRSSG